MTRTGTRMLGLICVILAVVCITVWIPLDTDTGLIEKVRRRVAIGDALAPTLACVFILIGGLVLCIAPGQADPDAAPMRPVVQFAAGMLGVLVLGFLVMLYAGPLAVAIATIWQPEPSEYRLLRGSFPWKYIGFVLGGLVSITGIICLAERRVSVQAILVGLFAVVAMIVLFDLPFDDLLLPPNGDY